MGENIFPVYNTWSASSDATAVTAKKSKPLQHLTAETIRWPTYIPSAFLGIIILSSSSSKHPLNLLNHPLQATISSLSSNCTGWESRLQFMQPRKHSSCRCVKWAFNAIDGENSSREFSAHFEQWCKSCQICILRLWKGLLTQSSTCSEDRNIQRDNQQKTSGNIIIFIKYNIFWHWKPPTIFELLLLFLFSKCLIEFEVITSKP